MTAVQMKTKVRELLEMAYRRELKLADDLVQVASIDMSDCKPALRKSLPHYLKFRQWALIFWRNVRNCKIDLVRKNLEMMKSLRNDLASEIFDASEHIPDGFYKDTLEEVQDMYTKHHDLVPILEMNYSDGIRWKCTIKSGCPKYKITVPDRPKPK